MTFFSLRGWGKHKSGVLTTEQVYIHGKTCIIDDRESPPYRFCLPLLVVSKRSKYVANIQDSFYVDLQISTRGVNGVIETLSYCLSLGIRI
jgi:hypothetical protein